MLEDISLAELGEIIKWLVAIIGGCVTLYIYMKKFVSKIQDEGLKPMQDNIKDVGDKIDSVSKDNAHNYIVHFQSMALKGLPFSADELQRYYENLTIYENLGGDGYIHATHDRLKRENKLTPTLE